MSPFDFETNDQGENSADKRNAAVTRAAFGKPQLKRLALIVGGIAAIVAVFILIALQSIPGGMLYPLKVDVIEEIAESARPTAKSKAQYQIERLEERLQEVKKLNSEASISEKSLAQLSEQTAKHFNVFNNYILGSIDSAFPKTEVLRALNEFASVAATIETIAENNPNFGSYGDEAEDVRQEIVVLYRDRAESFAATESLDSILGYIQELLGQVKDDLGTEGLGKEVIDDAENYLDRVGPALSSQNYTRAITAIGEAYRFIRVEKYGGDSLPQTETPEPSASNNETSTATTSTTTNEATAPTSTELTPQ